MDIVVLSKVMVSLFILWASHCIGDYPLQGEFLARFKSENVLVLLCHCTIYTACILLGIGIAINLGLWEVTVPLPEALLMYTMIIMASHLIIDYIKCDYRKHLKAKYPDLDTNPEGEGHRLDVLGYYYDQLAHLIVLVMIMFAIG